MTTQSCSSKFIRKIMKSEKKKKIFIDPDVMTWCWYFSPPHPPQPMAIYCLMKTADYLLINTVCIFFMTLYLWLSWVVIIIMKLYSGLVWSSFFFGFRTNAAMCDKWIHAWLRTFALTLWRSTLPAVFAPYFLLYKSF